MPVHAGHLALIDFAAAQCDQLIVLLCVSEQEPIPGDIRYDWLQKIFADNSQIIIQLFEYDESVLPNTSVSSQEVSRIWAEQLSSVFPEVNRIFASEDYGEYLAHEMGIEYQLFDPARVQVPISATAIRQHPFLNWEHIPLIVRPYFVKMICVAGTESTGKTSLVKRLATHFGVSALHEVARDIVEHTESCTYADLQAIAVHHAEAIQEATANAHKVLIVDTDVRITQSYSRFLFGRDLPVADWITTLNQFDRHLYLSADAPFVQDGTRLPLDQRNLLDRSHRQVYQEQEIELIEISGDWEARFERGKEVIEELLSGESHEIQP